MLVRVGADRLCIRRLGAVSDVGTVLSQRVAAEGF